MIVWIVINRYNRQSADRHNQLLIKMKTWSKPKVERINTLTIDWVDFMNWMCRMDMIVNSRSSLVESINCSTLYLYEKCWYLFRHLCISYCIAQSKRIFIFAEFKFTLMQTIFIWNIALTAVCSDCAVIVEINLNLSFHKLSET